MITVPPRHLVLRLAGLSGCDPRSIARAYKGQAVKGITFDRIATAARSLGLEPPPAVTATQAGAA